MTDQEIKAIVYAVMAKASLEEAKESVIEANDDFEINTTIFDYMLSYLMEKMPESEFLTFCESL